MARLRDEQVGCDARGFVRALRAQLLADAPEEMRFAICVRLAAMDKMLDEREAALRSFARRTAALDTAITDAG
jgi:hypothetical protein